MFGKNKKLIQMIELYDSLSSRKQIGFKDISKLNINEELLKKYSKKSTEKMYKELDMMGYIKEVSSQIEDKPFSIKQQVEFEIINLGYTTYTNESAGIDFYIIVEYKTYTDKTKPYVTLRNVKTGEEKKTKVKEGKLFSQNPFKLFSVLKVTNFSIQKKTKCINGKWKKTNEDEEILTEWEVY
jgi:DNA polymerase-3 subunit alpha